MHASFSICVEILPPYFVDDLKYIDVVTGRGVHSKQKIARLRSSVLNYLKGNQYRYA